MLALRMRIFTDSRLNKTTLYFFKSIYFTTPCTEIQIDVIRNEKRIIRVFDTQVYIGGQWAPCARVTLTSSL